MAGHAKGTRASPGFPKRSNNTRPSHSGSGYCGSHAPTAEGLFICHNLSSPKFAKMQSSLEQREREKFLGTHLQGRKQGRPEVRAGSDRGVGGKTWTWNPPSGSMSTLQP